MLAGIVYGLSNVVIRCSINCTIYVVGSYIKDKIADEIKKENDTF